MRSECVQNKNTAVKVTKANALLSMSSLCQVANGENWSALFQIESFIIYTHNCAVTLGKNEKKKKRSEQSVD